MKKYLNFQSIAKLVLFMLAVVTGGGAMAVEIGNEGPDARAGQTGQPGEGTAEDGSNSNGATDPAHPDANDRVAPGGKKEGQDLTGTQASATQVRKGGLAEDEWDNQIVQFRPWNTPLLALVRKVSKTYQTQGYERKHMRNGGDTLEAVINSASGSGIGDGTSVTIDLTPQNTKGNLRPFYKGTKIYCLGVAGYKAGSQTDREGILTLVVVDTNKNFSKITCAALNGPAVTEGEVTDELDCRNVPAIPNGTVLAAGAVSMSESQLLVTPENYRPTEHIVFLQKKGFNIIFTEEYEKIKKKQPLSVANIKADTMVKYNLRAERDYFLGTKARWNTTNEDGSVEYCYSAEGVIPQITQVMTVDCDYTLGLLGAINMTQFTEFSAHNVAYAFCGKNAMQSLNTLTLPQGYVHTLDNVSEFNIDFKRYKDTFGTMNYTWCQSLDMLGMSDCIVVLDLQGLVRYVHLAEKEQTNDMSKGAGEIRNAKRLIKTEADALALLGYNSLLVGPSSKVLGLHHVATTEKIQILSAVPSTKTSGMKVAFSKDLVDGTQQLEMGVVYIYNSTAAAWEVYKGFDVAV